MLISFLIAKYLLMFTQFPENEMKSWFAELLAEDDLTMDSFVSSVKTYNLPGDYRNMLVKPGDVTWKVVGYDDATEDLIVSDKEITFNMKDVSEKIHPGETNDPKFKALILNMSLPSSW